MKNLASIKTAGLCFTFLIIGSGPAWAGTVTIDMKNAYSISDSNGNTIITCNPPGNSTPTPVPVPAQPLATPSCTLTASPASISPGASSTLTANCTPAATSYIWNGPGMSGLSTGTYTGNVNPTNTATYSVKGVNASGIGNAVSASVTVSAITNTISKNCSIIDITWPPSVIFGTTPLQSMPADKMFAFKTKVTEKMYTQIVRFGTLYGNAIKTMTVSTVPCDFSPTLGPTNGTNRCTIVGRPDPSIQVGGPEMTENTNYCHLPPVGSTVYFNIKNTSGPTGANTCTSGVNCSYYFYR